MAGIINAGRYKNPFVVRRAEDGKQVGNPVATRDAAERIIEDQKRFPWGNKPLVIADLREEAAAKPKADRTPAWAKKVGFPMK